jgi:His-Xaa-Ser system radical SAM maturase HxsB
MKNKVPYFILPFRFGNFKDKILLTNDACEYHFLEKNNFFDYINYLLNNQSDLYQDLKSKQFLTDSDLTLPVELISTKLRTKKSFLNNFTSLHMMVITLRCNHNCTYCQASSESDSSSNFDMTPQTAKAVVDCVLLSPSNEIKIEFQGGEPLLNWGTIVETVNYAKELNKKYNKKLEFVICTNLTLIDNAKIEFIKKNEIFLSTSLDGNKELHDECRILRVGSSSYDLFIKKLSLANSLSIGKKVSPLLTITSKNIDHLNEVIDEYINLGFEGVFFRAINPYGFASKNLEELGYSIGKFIDSFESGLDYIIQKNLEGIHFVELYTNLLLHRILTPFGTGFVDLQSPSGAGISGVIYDFNGDVYPADEARMLAKMGDKYFFMGNVLKNSYKEIFNSNILKKIVSKSITEIMPECSHCVYQPFCGSDPVRNYLQTKDIVGHRPTSEFCKKHKGLFEIIFSKLLRNKENEINVFWSWVTKKPLEEINCEGM